MKNTAITAPQSFLIVFIYLFRQASIFTSQIRQEQSITAWISTDSTKCFLCCTAGAFPPSIYHPGQHVTVLYPAHCRVILVFCYSKYLQTIVFCFFKKHGQVHLVNFTMTKTLKDESLKKVIFYWKGNIIREQYIRLKKQCITFQTAVVTICICHNS